MDDSSAFVQLSSSFSRRSRRLLTIIVRPPQTPPVAGTSGLIPVCQLQCSHDFPVSRIEFSVQEWCGPERNPHIVGVNRKEEFNELYSVLRVLPSYHGNRSHRIVRKPAVAVNVFLVDALYLFRIFPVCFVGVVRNAACSLHFFRSKTDKEQFDARFVEFLGEGPVFPHFIWVCRQLPTPLVGQGKPDRFVLVGAVFGKKGSGIELFDWRCACGNKNNARSNKHSKPHELASSGFPGAKPPMRRSGVLVMCAPSAASLASMRSYPLSICSMLWIRLAPPAAHAAMRSAMPARISGEDMVDPTSAEGPVTTARCGSHRTIWAPILFCATRIERW